MKVLIPLDGSKFAEAVLDHAAKLTRESKAEIHLVTVVPETKAHMTLKHEYVPGNVSFQGSDPMGITRPQVVTGDNPVGVVEFKDAALERITYEFEDYLSLLSQRFPGRAVKTKVLVGDNVVDKIQGYARKNKIDLIVLSSHGRTGLAHMIMGSVAMELLRKGETPLLMVRPDGLYEGNRHDGKSAKPASSG
jgi:nucleotide-binding universal stress UspA family protein